jgi:hypothetical protein
VISANQRCAEALNCRLYVDPPPRTVLLSVDEKPEIAAAVAAVSDVPSVASPWHASSAHARTC